MARPIDLCETCKGDCISAYGNNEEEPIEQCGCYVPMIKNGFCPTCGANIDINFERCPVCSDYIPMAEEGEITDGAKAD